MTLSLPAHGQLRDTEIQGLPPLGVPPPASRGDWLARSDWRSRARSRPRLRAPRGVNGRRRRIGRRGAQTNRGRRWEYLLFTWKRLGAGRASSAPSAPRPATSAAEVLASRGSGSDMERRAPSGLSHRALCGEQGKTRRAVEGGKEESKCPTTGRRTKSSPPLNSPQRLCLRKKKENCPVFIPLYVFFPQTTQWPGRCTVSFRSL